MKATDREICAFEYGTPPKGSEDLIIPAAAYLELLLGRATGIKNVIRFG
jgi:hypothetical protein